MKNRNSLFITILSAVLILIQAGCTKNKQGATLQELDTIVQTYCSYIAAGKFHDAYNKCLNAQYRKDIPLDQFTAAHEKRKNTLGALESATMTYDKKSYNIFTGLTEYQLTYKLKYADKTYHEHIKLNNESGEFLIEGTYTSSASKTLRFMVW